MCVFDGRRATIELTGDGVGDRCQAQSLNQKITQTNMLR
jgi:hypothetical protein